MLELEKMNDSYQKDDLKKVPNDFKIKVVRAEELFHKIDHNQSVPIRVAEYVVRVLNKKYDLDVWVPPKVRFIVRKLDDKYDMDICSRCGFDKLFDYKYELSCSEATVATINKCILKAPHWAKKIYIGIRLYVGHETKVCGRDKATPLHANGLVIDMDKKTVSIHDPNGMPYVLSQFYKEFFSYIAGKLKTHSKKYKYKVADESCGFQHAGLCRYAVFIRALELDLSVKGFMTFVLDCLKYHYMLITLPRKTEM
jgi:hypothetical protein